MRIWHTATRNPEEAHQWWARFQAGRSDAAALVAPSTGPLACGDDARPVPPAHTMWGRITASDAECRWRVEGSLMALSIVAEQPIDGMPLDETDVDDQPRRSPLRVEPVVAKLLGTGELTEVTYQRDGIAWLTRTEHS